MRDSRIGAAVAVALVLALGCGRPVRPAAPDVPARVGRPMSRPASAPARDAALARTVAGVIDAVTNTDPVFTCDGARVVFSSNRDGLPQLYVGELARPDAPPDRRDSELACLSRMLRFLETHLRGPRTR